MDYIIFILSTNIIGWLLLFYLFTDGEMKRLYQLITFPGGKESACQCRRCKFHPWIGKILWSRKWKSTPVFLPKKFHGQRSLVSSSPGDCKESDGTECTHTQTHQFLTLSCTPRIWTQPDAQSTFLTIKFLHYVSALYNKQNAYPWEGKTLNSHI